MVHNKIHSILAAIQTNTTFIADVSGILQADIASPCVVETFVWSSPSKRMFAGKSAVGPPQS